MRRKLDTRFPAARIKKIMQADKDVGKIALAVPILVSKALELFLQDLCDRISKITHQSGMKTVSASHLKQCINSFNVFDFLKDVVSKVPDIGCSDAGFDDRYSKRRKTLEEENDSEEESKKTRPQEAGLTSGRGCGRGRGRRRGARSARGMERDRTHYDKYEDDPASSPQHEEKVAPSKILDNTGNGIVQGEEAKEATSTSTAARNFDLNLDINENEDMSSATATANTASASLSEAKQETKQEEHPCWAYMSAAPVTTNTASASVSETKQETKQEEYPSWAVPGMDKMAIDPLQFVLSNQRLEEEEEDYDNEEG